MTNPFNQNREQSEFNMAVSFLTRLNYFFYVCDLASMHLDVNQWFHGLAILYRELTGYMSEEEITTKQKELFDIVPALNNYLRLKNSKMNPEIPGELYKKLNDFEIFIRKVLKDSGLQTKMKDDPRFALSR